MNRQTLKTGAVGVPGLQRSTRTSYDAADNVLTMTNARNYTTSYAYDLLNRQTAMLEAVGDPAARSTATTYDADNNVSTVTDPRNIVSSCARARGNTESTSSAAAFTWAPSCPRPGGRAFSPS